jgi:uncharacterized repeat protein (TIGR02543 family)
MRTQASFLLLIIGLLCPYASAQAGLVIVGTSPSGRSFSVDGTTYTTAQTFSWTSGSSHTIATTSPQSGKTGTQYVWSSWSDGGGMSHTITTPGSNTTYTANFTTQYYLTMNAGTGGTVSPSSGFYNSGQSVPISASANSGYTFSGWTGSGTGSYTGSSNPGSVTMNGPITETANFTLMPVMTVSTTALSHFGNIQLGDSSASQQYTVSGSNLTAHIVVTAPSGFQVSRNNSSFSGAVTLIHSGGTVTMTTVYARFSPTVLGVQGGNITHSSTGATTSSVAVSGTGIPVTAVEDLRSALPKDLSLLQNYPNPFNPSTTIRYGLPHKSQVSLMVYNTLGQLVSQLVQGEQEPGYHEVRFDGTGLSSGVYFYRLQAGDFVQTRKLLLLR